MLQTSANVQQALKRLQPHDHLCFIYETHDEWYDTIVPFFILGLERGDKCAYIVDNHTADELRGYLRDAAIDVKSAESSGQLVIMHETEAYTKFGQFDPDRMIELLSQLAETTLREGYACLRLSGEMTWMLRGYPGSERLLEYESKLNRDFFQQYPCIGICQYDRKHFDPEVIEGAILTHPLLARGKYIYDNFYYMPTEEYLSESRNEHQIQGWLNNLERERRASAELKQTEEAFRESNAYLENLLNYANAPIIVWDPGYKIVRFNRAFERLTGYDADEVLGKSLEILFPDDQKAESMALIRRTASGERWETVEISIANVDGTVHTVLWNSATLFSPDNRTAIATIAQGQEITERKQLENELRKHRDHLEELVTERTNELEVANERLRREIIERKRIERALRKSDNQLRLITDSLPSLISYVDTQQRYLFVNRTYETWFGHPREELLGKEVRSVIGEEAYQEVQAYMETALSGEKATCEIDAPYKDGGARYTYSIYVPDIDEQGTVRGFIALVNDMTENRIMERKIAEALEFNQNILESSPVGIALYDSSGQWVYVNDAGADIAGGPKEVIMEQNFNNTESWKRNGLFDLATKVLKTGIVANKQIYFERNLFGKEVWLDCSLSRFSTGGEPHLLLIYNDVTSHKKAEERIRKLNEDLIRRADELTNINKELESFSYSVSHDLRAPLRSIHGFSQIIFNKYQDQLDEAGKDYLQIIRSECKRMGVLIDDMLALSRLSRKEISCEEVDLSSMAENIAADLQMGQPDRQAEFVIRPGIKVWADRTLLQSVLQNLLDNAWKFTNKHEKTRIEVGATERDGKRVYFVHDDGAGFDMKYVDKLFGAFQRLHAMDEFPGNGIGLAIIQRIIHRHGGQVWAEGAVEKGATFYFTLTEQGEKEKNEP